MISLLLMSATGWAQSGMTDNQVMDYVIEQNAKGVSRQQIVTQLMQRGVTMEQLQRLRKKYQRQMNNGALGAEDITAGSRDVKKRMREANGELREDQRLQDKQRASQFRIKDTKSSNQTINHTYDGNDTEYTDMDKAMDFMMPDSLKYSSANKNRGS